MTNPASPRGLPSISRSTLALAALAALVVAVLLHGASHRTRPGPAETPAPTGPAAPVLRADLEKSPLSYQSDFWLQLGSRVRNKLCLVGSRRSSALCLAGGLAVSTIDAVDGFDREGARAQASYAPSTLLLAADPSLGLALFQMSPAGAERAFHPADPASIHAGMLVAAISLDPEGRLEVMPGHVLSAAGPSHLGDRSASADALEVFVPLATSTAIAAIVDLDGDLVGVVLRDARGITVLSADSLLTAVARLRNEPRCRGLDVADPDDAVRGLLGARAGVVVEWVAPGAFGPETSLHAGDLLLEWQGKKVVSAPQFLELYDKTPPGAVVPYLARRGPRGVRGRLAMPGSDCRPSPEPAVRFARTGLSLAWDPARSESPATTSAWHVTRVTPGSPAQESGIQPGDRILSGGGPTSDREEVLAQITAFESQGRPIVLTVQRGDRVKLLALRGERR